MNAERWRQVESLFGQAVGRPLPERQAFLDRACQGDTGLRRELESLLDCDSPQQALVEISTSLRISPPGNGEPDAGIAGQRVGPYRLARLLGYGGMGAVYLGVRDDDQFQKQVAVKLLKRGMDTSFMLSRFRQERQILADLEHPFIARLLDGGATADGLPYFVMEYVEGIPITNYCDEKRLSVPERLRLFRLVCEAVQFAHQNLVVHRDIKPGNILTTKEGVPKLLDFGIAKVMHPGSPPGTTLTQPELRMLTPDYASPEQVKGLAISTASDTYSLGVVLYELLAGERPHRFASGSLADIERAICEMEPERPSIAAARSDSVPLAGRKKLARQLSGDLDNIVLTAMRKEPQRRYASAAEFSEDLRRHLEGLPVRAHADRWSYRTAKFIRRNKLAVGAGALLVASLVGGIVASTIQARRAERRFELVRQLANFVSFELYDRVAQLPGSTAVQAAMVQTVSQYLDRLAQDSAGDPALDLEIAKTYARVAAVEGHPFRANLGHAVVALGHYEKAIGIFERLASRAETRAEATRGEVDARMQAASVAVVLGHPAAAEAHLKRAASVAANATSERTVELHPSVLAPLYLQLGTLASNRGDTEAELAHVARGLELARKWVDGEPDPEALIFLRNAYSQLASTRAHSGDLYGAREMFLKAIDVAGQLKNRPDSSAKHSEGEVGILHVFGDLLGAPDEPNLGQPAEALAQYRAAAALGEGLTAADANDINSRRNLAGSYRRVGLMLLESQPAEALRFYRKAIAISESLAASEERNIHYRSALADACLGEGQALHRLGRRAEALASLGRTLELQESIEAAAPEQLWLFRTTSRAYLATGNVLLDDGDTDRALANYREGLARAQTSLERYTSSLHLELDRADLLEALGRYYATLAARSPGSGARREEWKGEARSYYEKSLAIWSAWESRKVAAPYAGRRKGRASSEIANIGRL